MLPKVQEPPFWLVWSPNGARSPTVKHRTEAEAEREAERLADLNPGREFYVVQPTYHVVSQRRLTTRYATGDDGVPF